MNNTKVFVLLAGMTAVMGMVGQAMGGQSGMLIALLIAGVMIFYMYFTSSTKVMKAYKAQTITREQAPELYEIVDKLRQRAGLPMPSVAPGNSRPMPLARKFPVNHWPLPAH
jgi:heat shock protein HtpX